MWLGIHGQTQKDVRNSFGSHFKKQAVFCSFLGFLPMTYLFAIFGQVIVQNEACLRGAEWLCLPG
jgi:hypothetical protein